MMMMMNELVVVGVNGLLWEGVTTITTHYLTAVVAVVVMVEVVGFLMSALHGCGGPAGHPWAGW